MTRFAVAVFLLAAVFGGYHVYQRVASPLMSAQTVADRVGAVYGDAHPRIVRVISDVTDGPTNEPMFLLTIRGHFHKGGRTARYLAFSALANRPYAWGLWVGNTLPSHTAHRSWFAFT